MLPSIMRFDSCRPPLPVSLNNTKHFVINKFKGKAFTLCRDSIIATAEAQANAVLDRKGLPQSFDRLIDSVNKSDNLSHLGQQMLFHKLVANVRNRILVTQYVKQHPDIVNEQIVKPIFIVGFPRTGTTLLHNLLSLYPNSRELLYWESHSLIPPVALKDRAGDPRVEMTQHGLDHLYTLLPNFRKIHECRAEAPEECLPLFENSFSCPSYTLFGDLPEYYDWLINDDLEDAYQFYKLQLQILQSVAPGQPWILKSPTHMYYIDTLLKTFPDACIVQPHREVSSVLSSRCSLHTTFKRAASRRVNYHHVGKTQFNAMSIQLEKCLSVRDKYDVKHFCDVQYTDVIKEPKPVVTNILKYFQFPDSEQHHQLIDQWLAEHPQNKFGVHKHDLKQFGLKQELVDTTFSEYSAKYLK